MSEAAIDLDQMGVPERVRDQISRNPHALSRRIDGIRAEMSLSDFCALMWPILEPRRKLVRGYAFDLICAHLEAVHYGEIRHLLINVPPGFTKSILCNVMFPAWEWGPRNRPDLRHLAFSYDSKLTVRDNRKCRQVIQSDLYQELWGDRFWLVSDQNAKVRYDTNHAGWKLASSVGGTGTGERGDRVMIDDPNNVKTVESDVIRGETNFWFAEVTPSRINDPDISATVVIQQRTHEMDVSGLILSSHLPFEHLCIPMEYEVGRRCFTVVPRHYSVPQNVRKIKRPTEPLPEWIDEEDEIPAQAEVLTPVRTLYSQDWRTEEGQLAAPNRYSSRHLEEELKPTLRLVGGTYAESGQLQQSPSPRGGGLFHKGDFRILDLREWTAATEGIIWARGYDLASTEDDAASWSACAKVGVRGTDTFIADVDRVHKRPGGVMKWMIETAERDGFGVEIDFPQDPAQAGKWQRSYVAGNLGGYIVHSSPEGKAGKEKRAGPLASQGENGNLYLLRGPWNDMFIAEAAGFPRGKFKDQIDAAVRGYARALKLKAADSIPVGPKIITGG